MLIRIVNLTDGYGSGREQKLGIICFLKNNLSSLTHHQCSGSMFFSLPNPVPYPVLRAMGPDPDKALDPNPDPSIIMQKQKEIH